MHRQHPNGRITTVKGPAGKLLGNLLSGINMKQYETHTDVHFYSLTKMHNSPGIEEELLLFSQSDIDGLVMRVSSTAARKLLCRASPVAQTHQHSPP